MNKLRIALIPDQRAIASIIEFQKEINKIYPIQPLLGDTHNLPHITLLQGRFNYDLAFDHLLLEIKNICHQQNESLSFKFTTIKYQQPSWLFLNIKSTLNLLKVHELVFDKVKSKMYLTPQDLDKDLTGYTDQHRQNYLNYGYRYLKDCYQPHITMGRLYSLINEQTLKMMEKVFQNKLKPFNGNIEKITVFKVGHFGNHYHTVNEILL